jgi:hypothetical protein
MTPRFLLLLRNQGFMYNVSNMRANPKEADMNWLRNRAASIWRRVTECASGPAARRLLDQVVPQYSKCQGCGQGNLLSYRYCRHCGRLNEAFDSKIFTSVYRRPLFEVRQGACDSGHPRRGLFRFCPHCGQQLN